uniref:BZIP domain-containing protein n=1 Tax=Steinernema glaseri TaxID=37863 RepID=A0A1I7YB27_9BILA
MIGKDKEAVYETICAPRRVEMSAFAKDTSWTTSIAQLTTEVTQQAYYARRHRNNESAKKSRELRRKKEEERERAMKFLEFENQRLRLEIDNLKKNILHLQQVYHQAQAQLQVTQIS